jgi:hypothetical protein
VLSSPTYVVVPVLVFERVGPADARSLRSRLFG